MFWADLLSLKPLWSLHAPAGPPVGVRNTRYSLGSCQWPRSRHAQCRCTSEGREQANTCRNKDSNTVIFIFTRGSSVRSESFRPPVFPCVLSSLGGTQIVFSCVPRPLELTPSTTRPCRGAPTLLQPGGSLFCWLPFPKD